MFKYILGALLALALTGCAHAGSSYSSSFRSTATFSRPTYVSPPKVTYTAPVAPRVASPVVPAVRSVAPVAPVVRAPVVVAPRVYVRPSGVSYWHNWYLWNYLYNRPTAVVVDTPDGPQLVVVHRHAGFTILAGIIALLIIFAAVGVILSRD